MSALSLIALLFLIVVIPKSAAQTQSPAPAQQQQPQQPPNATPQQPAPAPAATPAPAPPLAPPVTPPQRPAFVVILDPGHGGADNGARGAAGVVEKDIALALARATRAQLQQQGIHVLLTRDGDDDPSFDDRATLPNAQRSAVLVSFHVSSTGKVGTVRSYYYVFSAPGAPSLADTSKPPVSAAPPPRSTVHLIPWNRAQENFANSSHHLADMIQSELVKNFPGSPAISIAVPLRDLRSVAAPAVAVELSSVAVEDRGALEAMFTPLSASISRAIVAFHAASEAGAH